jgi:uncharacterized protein (DUF169 family)
MNMSRSSPGAKLSDLLGLTWRPVALAFRPSAPPGINRVNSPKPAGCAYWKLAAEGQCFYTEASDHYDCPIGAHTHGVDLPPEKAKELESTIATMAALEYFRMEEVPGIPRVGKAFGVVVYAPLSDPPCDPDVVLVRGNAKQVMLLGEASRAAGLGHEDVTMGRPTCAMIPMAMQSGRGVNSFGCIGNRVYTELRDDELYYAIPGSRLEEVVGKLETIIKANRELDAWHRARSHLEC